MAGMHDPNIACLNALMAWIPMTTEYSPKWWWQSLNVMLENLLGNCDVVKLHIIHLFKGNFNFNNKWLGKTMIAQAESKGLLAHEQYGSWKAKDAITQCFNKCLLGMIMFNSNTDQWLYAQMMQKLLQLDHFIGSSIMFMLMGVSFAMVSSMTSTLQAMTHHVQTASGDSATGASCKHWNKPVAGIGQGNGMGPQIWAAVCTPLFKLLCTDGFVSKNSCAISQLSWCKNQ